jgi:hypothetical protein
MVLLAWPMWRLTSRVKTFEMRQFWRAMFFGVLTPIMPIGEGHGTIWFTPIYSVMVGIREVNLAALFLLGVLPIGVATLVFWLLLALGPRLFRRF